MRSLILSVCLLILCSSSIHAQITQYTTENSGIASNDVADIQLADDGTVWVVHANTPENSGLVSAFYDNEWTIFSDLSEICDAALYGNSLILATYGGLYKYSDGIFDRIEALGEMRYTSVLIGENNILWAKASPLELRHSDSNSKYNLMTDTLEQSWLVSGNDYQLDNESMLGIDSNGALWYQSADGLYRYDGTQWQWLRDVTIVKTDISPLYRFMPDLTSEEDGTVWLGMDRTYQTITFDGTTFYRSTKSLGNAVVDFDGTVWTFFAQSVYRVRDNQRELAYLAESGYGISCLAITDSTMWIGHNGVSVVSLEYLNSLPFYLTEHFLFQPIASVSEPQSYGDDFTYFPLHIGDTWVYDRELWDNFEMIHTDTVVNTVVDTVTVDGEISFKFLSGQLMRAGQDSLIYFGDYPELDFRDPENKAYSYQASSSYIRKYEGITVPAGIFMGYRFSVQYLGGTAYRTVPNIGIVYKSRYDDIGDEESLSLISATINGRTIDEIMPVENTPQPYSLDLTAYPNPFNPTTTIGFTLPESAPVKLAVYNLAGQKVVMLVDGPMNAGAHTVTFDGTGLASGVYVYHLESPGLSGSGKMLLMK